MANPKGERLMQEALDDQLSPEALQELYARLDDDPVEADEFSRLRTVDRLLRAAPHERAPERLAVRIMARLAQELQNPKLDRLSSLAFAIGLTIVALVLVPLLVTFGYLLVTALGSASFFNSVLQAISAAVAASAAFLGLLVESAQSLFSSAPILPVGLLALIPVGLLWLRRLSRQNPPGDKDK